MSCGVQIPLGDAKRGDAAEVAWEGGWLFGDRTRDQTVVVVRGVLALTGLARSLTLGNSEGLAKS